MSDTEEFLAIAVKDVNDAIAALHDGDPEPQIATWGRREPLTVMGARGFYANGWSDCERLFRMLGDRFSAGRVFGVETVAVEVSGDLAYTVTFEDSVASFDGSGPRQSRLRVTQIYRREDEGWRLVHRHADHVAGFPRDLEAGVPA